MSAEAPLYVTIAQAAELLGVSPYSVRRLVRRRLIPHYLYPVGGLRIAVADLEAFRDRWASRCCRAPDAAGQADAGAAAGDDGRSGVESEASRPRQARAD